MNRAANQFIRARGSVLLAVFLLALFTGCSGKENFVLLTAAEDGTVGALKVENEAGSTVLDQQGKAVYISDDDSAPSAPREPENDQIMAVFDDALRVHPLMPESFLLYFTFDSDGLTKESTGIIDAIVDAVAARDSSDIYIVGHTDRTGEDDYNRELSMKRASTVVKLLVDAGIPEKNLIITYHGEGNPLVPTADNVPEPRNRRVEVMVR